MDFSQYLQLGLEHIADLNAYDHILFIVAMCAVYRPADWRKLLVLVTAFTVGHSLTLALAAWELVNIPSDFIELLIPITIVITALLNLFPRKEMDAKSPIKEDESLLDEPFFDIKNHPQQRISIFWTYAVVLFFGLIHGLGFSNYFRMLLGTEDSIVMPLLGFNLGVEIGQVGIVLMFMSITYAVLGFLGVRLRDWTIFVSGGAFMVALTLIIG